MRLERLQDLGAVGHARRVDTCDIEAELGGDVVDDVGCEEHVVGLGPGGEVDVVPVILWERGGRKSLRSGNEEALRVGAGIEAREEHFFEDVTAKAMEVQDERQRRHTVVGGRDVQFVRALDAARGDRPRESAGRVGDG
jgi:hypothetical protein